MKRLEKVHHRKLALATSRPADMMLLAAHDGSTHLQRRAS
jgi:hypothetical protein